VSEVEPTDPMRLFEHRITSELLEKLRHVLGHDVDPARLVVDISPGAALKLLKGDEVAVRVIRYEDLQRSLHPRCAACMGSGDDPTTGAGCPACGGSGRSDEVLLRDSGRCVPIDDFRPITGRILVSDAISPNDPPRPGRRCPRCGTKWATGVDRCRGCGTYKDGRPRPRRQGR